MRVNAVGSPWHDEDIEFAASRRFGGIVIPKAEEPSSIERAGRLVAAPVVLLVESAQGYFNVQRIAQARGVARLAFGHLDFQIDVGVQCGEDERELDSVRLAIALASRRAGLPAPIDGVTTALEDRAKLRVDTQRSKRLGFRGKLCIHPKQLEIVNETFAPTDGEQAWARRILAAVDAAGPAGAFRLDGQMVDAPIIRRAQALLDDM